MTKAELLHRFRWVFLILPIATAAGFRLFLFLMQRKAVLSLAFPSPVETALAFLFRVSDFVPVAWLLLTFACSAGMAEMMTARADAEKRRTRGLMFAVLMTPLIFFVHMAAVVLLIWIFPWR